MKLNIGFGYDNSRLKIVEDTAPFEVKYFVFKEGFHYKEFFFTFGYTYNSLDKLLFPTDGWLSHLSFRFSLPGSNLRYYTFSYDVSFYKKYLMPEHNLQLHKYYFY